ncbi:MAG: cytochrome c biogenesis protein ResB [Elusimicrobia bacterium]|nr:cytochrome c biogenesis protein ResB [Elusimicrobiota bacterium]
MEMFRSVKFNVGLICVLAFACGVGSFIPQAAESPERVEVFLRAQPFWGGVLEGAGLFNVFRNWWFFSLLALLGFDIALCKCLRLPGLEPQESAEEVAQSIGGRPLRASFMGGVRPAAAAEAIRSLLRASGYSVRQAPGADSDRVALCASRHRLQRWGSFISHSSMVVILAGGLVKLVFGFQGSLAIPEGGQAPVPRRPGWELAMDRFQVEHYQGSGSPKLFASDLRLLDRGRVLAQKLIRVNKPMVIGRLGFYQETWGATGAWRSATLSSPQGDVVLRPGRAQALPGGRGRVSVGELIPDIAIAEDGHAHQASSEPRNPALRVRWEAPGQKPRALWLLRDEPDAAFAEDARGVLSRVPPPFRLAAVDMVLFSGIQFVYDPGYPLIVAGALAWLAGMMLLFYLHGRRLWVLVSPGTGQACRVLMGGWNSQGPVAYRDEFEALTERMREVSS